MNLEENISGIRVAVDERKHNPKDFVLWKASKPGEPSWDSLWGHGRPGWHIECSAISAHYLTITFDIHAGGRDLIFPHQENEIAQNWAACSESDISYWIHIGTVTRNNLKISKSDGNFISIREPNVSMCKFFVAIEKQIKELLCILGLLPTSYSEVLLQLKDKALIREGLVEDAVKLFIEERAVARGNRDYSRSDKIREKLAKNGIALMDVGNDTIWRPCLPVEDGQQAKQLSSQQ